jgi:hypothetical protein
LKVPEEMGQTETVLISPAQKILEGTRKKKYLVDLAVFALWLQALSHNNTVTKNIPSQIIPAYSRLEAIPEQALCFRPGLLSNSAMLESIMGGEYLLLLLTQIIGTSLFQQALILQSAFSIGDTTPSMFLA